MIIMPGAVIQPTGPIVYGTNKPGLLAMLSGHPPCDFADLRFQADFLEFAMWLPSTLCAF